MSSSDPKTIRLRVSYKNPEGLLSEYTRSIGKGGVAIESRKAVPVGTRFIFELQAQGVDKTVEVYGEVIGVSDSGGGKKLLNIRYDPGQQREGLDALLSRIFEAHRYEKVRKFPRVPLNLRATEELPYSPSYLIKDISMGGMGVEIEASNLPRSVKVGTPFLCEVWLSLGTLALYGEVVWAFVPKGDKQKITTPSFGVSFGKLRPDTQERLERIIQLKSLPPPPWKARVSFGMDAVARMP